MRQWDDKNEGKENTRNGEREKGEFNRILRIYNNFNWI